MNTAKRANCRVLIIANQKGGVAKSASAVNLSAALALNGKKVLMIDADSQGTGSNMFGIDDVDSLEITLATVLGKIINDEDVDPSEGIIKNAEGVDILPSNIDLAALEASLVNVMNYPILSYPIHRSSTRACARIEPAGRKELMYDETITI